MSLKTRVHCACVFVVLFTNILKRNRVYPLSRCSSRIHCSLDSILLEVELYRRTVLPGRIRLYSVRFVYVFLCQGRGHSAGVVRCAYTHALQNCGLTYGLLSPSRHPSPNTHGNPRTHQDVSLSTLRSVLCQHWFCILYVKALNT